MTLEERKQEILAQPSAMKEVYGPDQDPDHTIVNSNIIIRGPDMWHLIYSSEPGGRNTRISHATSDDLIIWTKQDPILGAGNPGDCDAQEVSDPAVVNHEGRWYMIYQCTPALGTSRRFALAVSDDLWTWRKLPGDGSSTFIPHTSWSGWQEEGVVGIGKPHEKCKGPSIFCHDGRYLMYYSSETKWGDSCIALARSKDMVHWEDEGPFISQHRTNPDNPVQGPSGFEVPRVVENNGKYYLFVMHFWGLQYAVGDDPFHFGSWKVLGPWHAPFFFEDDQGNWYITHALRPFGKPSTKGSLLKPLRGLYIGGLVWSDDVPVPVDLGDVLKTSV